MNCRPLSDTMEFGTPNRHTMFFRMKFWTLRADMVARGSVSIHFVK